MTVQPKRISTFYRLLAVMLASFMVAMLLNFSYLPVQAEESNDLNSLGLSGSEETEQLDESFYLGESSEQEEQETVQITSESDLVALAQRVNEGDSMENVLVVLEQDITLSIQPWVPIGNDALTPFSGTFDGQGYTIRNIQVAENAEGGLFGYLSHATVTNLNLADCKTPNSTGGFFFIANQSTVELSTVGIMGTPMSISISPRSGMQIWDGTSDTSWYSYGQLTYEISTPEQFQGLNDVVNLMSDSLSGVTIVLTGNFDMGAGSWTPLGNLVAFSGRFIGNGNTISNLDNSLFEITNDATVTGVNLVNSQINRPFDGAGIVVSNAVDTDITYVSVFDSNIVANQAAGIVNNMSYSVRGALLMQCLVVNTDIVGSSSASGIVSYLSNYSVSQCAVYGGSIASSGGTVAGITGMESGPMGTYAVTSQCVVLGTDFNGSGSGIISNSGGWNSASDHFISDITQTGSNFYLGANSIPNGIEYFLSDSPLMVPYLSSSGGAVFAVNNYRDDVGESAPDPYPYMGRQGNRYYSTAYLTNGKWTPSDVFWEANEGFYPQIKTLSDSTNPHIQAVSELASVALRADNSLEKYTVDARELRLMKQTPSGTTITWSYPAGIGVEERQPAGAPYKLLYTTQNSDVAPFTLQAQITCEGETYTKNFYNVVLKDSFLEEDVAQRQPSNTDASLSPIVPLTQAIQLTFVDPIEENPNVSGMVRLYSRRPGETGWTKIEQTIACVTTDTRFILNTTAQTVELDFELRPGYEYRVQLPSGMVKEFNKDNYSEEVNFYFETAAIGAPVIELQTNKLSWTSENAFTQNDLLSQFKVYDMLNSNVLYDFAVNPTLPVAYTGVWDDNDIPTSLANMEAAVPAGGVSYYLDSSLLIGANPPAGIYRLYVSARNSANITASKVQVITVKSVPYWTNAPANNIHLNWTDDLEMVKDIARQDASAAIRMSDGSEVICPLMVSVNQSEWDFSLAVPAGPSKVTVTLSAIDQSGNAGLTEQVTVYLDKPLEWRMNSSPVSVYDNTTKKQVEALIGFQALNFDHNIITYEHSESSGEYRDDSGEALTYSSADGKNPKLYYIDITSKPQQTTLCTDPNCGYPGTKHPADRVNDTFLLNVVPTPGAETDTFWGNAAAEIENATYSQDVIELEPTSYLLPSFIPAGLAKQNYGRIQMEYGQKYRWKLYSNAISVINQPWWSEVYSLEVNFENDPRVTALLEDPSQAVQLNFEQAGKLFGIVEFDVSLKKAQENGSKITDENLMLYRYDQENNELVPVSDVIVENGDWASSMLTELWPTTYVLQSKASPDDKAPTMSQLENELTINYRDTSGIKAQFLNDRDLRDSVEPVANDLSETSTDQSSAFNNNSLWIALIGAAVLAAAGAGLAAYRFMRKEKK